MEVQRRLQDCGNGLDHLHSRNIWIYFGWRRFVQFVNASVGGRNFAVTDGCTCIYFRSSTESSQSSWIEEAGSIFHHSGFDCVFCLLHSYFCFSSIRLRLWIWERLPTESKTDHHKHFLHQLLFKSSNILPYTSQFQRIHQHAI